MRKETIVFIILVFVASSSFAQDQTSRKEKKQNQYKETFNLIESGKFIFEANQVIPKGGGLMDLTSNPNYLKINDGNANAYLPFFGEMYTVINYGEGGTINFENQITDYKVTQKETKHQIEINFKVNTQNDVFACYLNVSSSGRTSLSVNSSSRSYIQYKGKIKPFEQ